MLKYKLSQHAEDALKAREISEAWVERVLLEPERIEPDRIDPQLEHRLGAILEYGNRVLRVVLNKESKPINVVTAYFDRKIRDKL